MREIEDMKLFHQLERNLSMRGLLHAVKGKFGVSLRSGRPSSTLATHCLTVHHLQMTVMDVLIGFNDQDFKVLMNSATRKLHLLDCQTLLQSL